MSEWTSLSLWLAHPDWLGPAALGVGVVAVLCVVAFLGARRRMALLMGPAGARASGPRGLLPDGVLVLALACVAGALAGPQLDRPGARAALPGEGLDLAIAVDVSRSMDAADVAPSRLRRAQKTAGQVLARLGPGSRAALVGFAGRAVVFAPLTPDLGALAQMVDALDTRLVGSGGSRLALGIEAAVSVFEAGSERPRALLVLSDGEESDPSTDDGTGAVRRAGVRVVAAAIGTETGATVPDRGDVLRDSRGEVVLSRRRQSSLEQLAEAGDGAVFASDSLGRIDAGAIVDALRSVGDGARGEEQAVPSSPLLGSPWLVLATAAFALLAWEALGIPAARVGRARALALAGVVLVTLGADPARERSADEAAREVDALEQMARGRALGAEELIRLGVARAAAGREREAEHALQAAALSSPDPSVAALAYHDLGVLALQRGDRTGARDWFFDALAADPGRGESRFDLEWTLLALDEHPAPAPPPDARDSVPETNEATDAGEPPALPPALEAPKPAEEAAEPAAPGGTEGEAPSAVGPPPLDPAERARWLARVEDDLGRALATAVPDDPSQRQPRDEVTW